MAAFQPWKVQEPVDRFSRDRRKVRLAPENDVFASTACLDAAPAPFDAAAEGDENLLAGLLCDVPDEVLAAANQIIKGQMTTQTEPGSGLELMHRPDGLRAVVNVPEDYAPVSSAIMEDARPLSILED
jgi:hypothetical protein